MTMLKNILADTDHMSLADLRYWLRRTEGRVKPRGSWYKSGQGYTNAMYDINVLRRVLGERTKEATNGK